MKPAYLVRGDDQVLLSEVTRRVVGGILGEEDPGLALEEFVFEAGETPAVGALLDACLTPPFLTDLRVVVGRNAGALTVEDGARVVEYLDDPLDTTVLILVGGGGTVPPKLVAAIKKAGEVVEAGLPRQAKERMTWLVERLRKAPVTLDAAAGNLLGEHLGEDMGRLAGILEVLRGAYGEGASIGTAQLEPFLGEAGGIAPWSLTDAIDQGDAGSAIPLLHRMMTGGDRHPLVVMATLHRHYGQMLRLDGSGCRNEAEAAKLLGIKGSTYPAKKAMTQGRRLGSARILRAVGLLAEADLDLRGQKSWPDALVMEVLVARLCQLRRV